MLTREHELKTMNGWAMLVLLLGAGVGLALWFIEIIKSGPTAAFLITWSLSMLVWAIMLGGFFALQPNMAAVLVLFGRYAGTAKTSGFHWANPFFSKTRVSLRARN